MTRPPAVQRLGDAVLLQGPAVAEALYLVTLGLRWRSRADGSSASGRHLELLAVLADAAATTLPAASEVGHADVRDPPGPAPSSLTTIDTREAARMLGISSRQVRRLAVDLDGRRVRGVWSFDRAAVVAAAAHRKETG